MNKGVISSVAAFVLILLVSGKAFSSEPKGKIEARDAFLGPSFYLEGRRLHSDTLKAILSVNGCCESFLKRSRLYSNVASTLVAVSGSVFLYGTVMSSIDRRLHLTPITLGLSTFVAEVLAFNYLDKRNSRMAVEVYNQGIRGAGLQFYPVYTLRFSKTF